MGRPPLVLRRRWSPIYFDHLIAQRLDHRAHRRDSATHISTPQPPYRLLWRPADSWVHSGVEKAKSAPRNTEALYQNSSEIRRGVMSGVARANYNCHYAVSSQPDAACLPIWEKESGYYHLHIEIVDSDSTRVARLN